jgi:voltage-gated potassium channel
MLTSSSDIGQETDNHRHDDAKDPKRSEHLLVNECTSLLHSSPVEQQQRQTPGTSKDYNPSVSFNFDDQSEHEDEEESSIMLAEEGRRSRQNSSSFLTRSTTAASDSKSTTSRSSNHWKKLRGHIQRGSFLLIPQANQHGNHHNMEQEESSSSHNNSPAGKKRRSSGMSSQVEDRAQVMEEMIQEIREGMTFTVNQCIWAMVAFVLLSIVCYSFILEPSWTMLESCHYAMSTVLTVGYGNYVPTTDISRLFTCLYVLVGVSFLGVVLGIIGSSIMDHHSRSKEASDAMKRYQVLSLFSPSSSFGQDSDCESKKQDLQSATTLIDQDSKESSLHALSMQSIRTSRRSALLLHYVYHSPFLPLLIASCLLGGSIGYISKWSFISTLYFMVTSGE